MHTINIDIFVNQLGNLKIRWEISPKLLDENEEIEIQLPSFKYDLPRLAGVPVPFSSKALPLNIENISLENNRGFTFNLTEDFHGNNKLIIQNKSTETVENDKPLILYYEVKEIVNNDSIYFVFVYPLINPFNQDIIFKIDIKARFSFHIRKYKFREWYFNCDYGKKEKVKKVFSFSKVGDLITVWTDKLLLKKNMELDIHLTGTRFPIMIRRDIFWFLVFLFSLVIILSPIWSALI